MEEKNILDYDGLNKFKEMNDLAYASTDDKTSLQSQIDELKSTSGGITAKIVRW